MAGSKESSGNGQKNENIDNKWANLGEQSSAESAITNRDVEYFKENPAELSNLVSELVQMRPLEDDKRAGYDKEMHADVDRNGLPLGASHLIGYLKKNPEDIKLVLSEYQTLQKQQEALTQDADHFKEHPEDLNALCGALISMRSEEKRKDGVWDKDQMARIGADGMPTDDAAHLTKYLKEHPDDIEKVLTEAQQLGRAEQYAKDNSAFFRNNPDQIFKMTTELYQRRGGSEAGAGKGFNADGIPNDPAQLTHYLKEHPGKIRPFLKELAMLRYESSDGEDLDKKLEDMAERGDDYNPSNDFSGEQNIGVNGKERRNGNVFDLYPKQKGESNDDYGARLRWQREVTDFFEKNPQNPGESNADYKARLESLGMASTFAEYQARQNKAEENPAEAQAAESDHKRLSKEELKALIKEHPRKEGENTFDYAQRIYDETGIQIGNHINKEKAPDNKEGEKNDAEALEKARLEQIDIIFQDGVAQRAEAAGFKNVADLKKLSLEELTDLAKRLKAEEDEFQALKRFVMTPDRIADFMAASGAKNEDDLRALPIDYLRNYKKKLESTDSRPVSAVTEEKRIDGVPAPESQPATPVELNSETNSTDDTNEEASDIKKKALEKMKEWMQKKIEVVRDIFKKKVESEAYNATMYDTEPTTDALCDVARRWNEDYSLEDKLAIAEGDFSSFEDGAPRALHDREMLVKYGLVEDMPDVSADAYKFPDEDYGVELSNAAKSGKYESSVEDSDGTWVTKVEFSDDEIAALARSETDNDADYVSDYHSLSDALAIFNAAPESIRRALAKGNVPANADFAIRGAYSILSNYGGLPLIGNRADVEMARMRILRSVADERSRERAQAEAAA